MDNKILHNLELLGLIAGENSAGIERCLGIKQIDFKHFKDFVDIHQLSGNLYVSLGHSSLKGLFPAELIEHFKFLYTEQWLKNEVLLREIEDLGREFERKSLEVLFLKGPFFVQRFYGDIDRRVIRDIDILVRKKDIDKADRILSARGFRRDSATLFNKNLTTYFTHHFEYWKEDLPLDLHWALTSHFSFNLNYPEIWDKKQPFMFKGRVFYVLGDEYKLVFRILSLFADIQIGNLSLKSILDTYMMLSAFGRDVDWEQFFTRRRKERLFRIALNVLDLVLDILNCRRDFLELSRYLEASGKYIKHKSRLSKFELLNRSRSALNNKLWAFSLYQGPVFASFLWWTFSLPFRVAIHRKG